LLKLGVDVLPILSSKIPLRRDAVLRMAEYM
jgi:hypothetical protein